MAKMMCKDCGEVYDGGPASSFCQDCRRRRVSEAAKARHLCKLGNTARSGSGKDTTMIHQEGDSLQEIKYACTNNSGVVCKTGERNCEACGWNPKVAKARLEKRFPSQKEKKKPNK